MRFEDFVREDQLRILDKLHRRLNRKLFNGELSQIDIRIEHTEDTWANYRRELGGDQWIVVSEELIDLVLANRERQLDQVYVLSLVLLHEMIHQYCYEQGLEDEDHEGDWLREALAHGLRYREGHFDPDTESLSPLAFMAINNFYMK